MQLKDQVLGEVLLVAPNNPSNANIAQSKLVSRCIDGNYPGDLEVPNEVRVCKWRDKSTRCSVNSKILLKYCIKHIVEFPTMNRDRMACTSLILIQEVS